MKGRDRKGRGRKGRGRKGPQLSPPPVLLQVERLPALRLRHAAGHLPHVHLPQEASAPTQEEEEEEKAEPGRHVERRRRSEGEEQQQEPAGHLLHGLWEGHQRWSLIFSGVSVMSPQKITTLLLPLRSAQSCREDPQQHHLPVRQPLLHG